MSEDVLEVTKLWLERAVIGLELCPFAKAPYFSDRVRFVVSEARDADALLGDLGREMQALDASDASVRETTLLIHPHVLQDFLDYNDFLDVADAALAALNLDEALQVASFHPHYEFADTDTDDISNYSNRSPYPMLQILRNDSVDRAVRSVPDSAAIYERNIDTLRRLGHTGWARLFE